MGAWGTGISDSDTYQDIYLKFFNLYNRGLHPSELSTRLLEEQKNSEHDTDIESDFWFALSKAQWECKALEEYVFEKVKLIVESGSDLENWKRLGAGEPELKKRKLALQEFLESLQKEKLKPKPRRKIKITQPKYKKGDCLVFKFKNGYFGGAIVLEEIRDTEEGLNLIAVLRLHQLQKPGREDFIQSELLFLNYPPHENKPAIHWYTPATSKKPDDSFEIVSNLDIEIDYSPGERYESLVSDLVFWTITMPGKQFVHEDNHAKSYKRVSFKGLTVKRMWSF